MDKTRELTLGEQRVRVDFNTSGDLIVDNIKRETASIINTLQVIKENTKSDDSNVSEKLRLISLAQTAYEEAAMWAVKAATI